MKHLYKKLCSVSTWSKFGQEKKGRKLLFYLKIQETTKCCLSTEKILPMLAICLTKNIFVYKTDSFCILFLERTDQNKNIVRNLLTFNWEWCFKFNFPSNWACWRLRYLHPLLRMSFMKILGIFRLMLRLIFCQSDSSKPMLWIRLETLLQRYRSFMSKKVNIFNKTSAGKPSK